MLIHDPGGISYFLAMGWSRGARTDARRGHSRGPRPVQGEGVLARTSLLHQTGTRVFLIADAALGVTTVYARPDQADLIKLVELVESQSLTLRVAATHPLEGAAVAQQTLLRGHVSGKIIPAIR